MTRQRIEAFIQRQIDALNSGDAELLVRLMRPPLPVFHPQGDKYILSEQDIRSSVGTTLEALRRIGADCMDWRLRGVTERPGTGTVSCLIELQYLGPNNDLLRTTRVRHYLELDHDDIRIVMVEYLHAAFEEIFEKFSRPH